MLHQNSLLKILPFMPLMILASCSSHDDKAWPVLAGDDLWDQIAMERDQPLPEADKAPIDESQVAAEDIPELPPAQPLTTEDIDKYLKILRSAEQKFARVSADLDKDYREFAKTTYKQEERESLWRTLQFHLSRLTNLQMDLNRAATDLKTIHNLSDQDQRLLDNSPDLLTVITEKVSDARNRLNELTP